MANFWDLLKPIWREFIEAPKDFAENQKIVLLAKLGWDINDPQRDQISDNLSSENSAKLIAMYNLVGLEVHELRTDADAGQQEISIAHRGDVLLGYMSKIPQTITLVAGSLELTCEIFDDRPVLILNDNALPILAMRYQYIKLKSSGKLNTMNLIWAHFPECDRIHLKNKQNSWLLCDKDLRIVDGFLRRQQRNQDNDIVLNKLSSVEGISV